MILMNKIYCGESLYDIDSDIYDAISIKNPAIATDEHGFLTGTFKVTLEWIPPEEDV